MKYISFVLQAILVILINNGTAATQVHLQPEQIWDRENTIFLPDHRDPLENSDDHFVYATCTKSFWPLKLECAVNIRFHRSQPELEQSCTLSLLPMENINNNEDLELVGLYRLDSNRVILKWIELRRNVVVNARYTVLHMDRCAAEESSFPVGMSKTDRSFMNELIFYDENQFDYVISSMISCKGQEKCLMWYDRVGNKQIGFDIYSLGLTGVTLENADMPWEYFVQGHDKSGRFKLMFVDSSALGAQTDLITLDADVHKVSSSSKKYQSVCYTKKHTANQEVHCEKYTESLEKTLDKDVAFPEPIKMIDVVATGNADQHVTVLISEKAHCYQDECWSLYVTTFQCNDVTQIQKFRFECSGDRKNLVVRVVEVNGQKTLFYGCEKFDLYDSGRTHFNVGQIPLKTSAELTC